jgi:serine phosphatase RsbU (regulator of sigma subunit)
MVDMSERRHERLGLAAALATLALIVVLDAALGSDVRISGIFSMAAVVASATTSVRSTAAVGALAVALAALSGLWNQNLGDTDWAVRLVLAAALAAVATCSAVIRVRREMALRHMRVIAETAQRAVLRAMPSTVDHVSFAARYVSATHEALVGGDLYEVVATPYGVRVIVGDVRGKGLEAVQLAATVIGGFRQAAYREPTLSVIAEDLDSVVQAVAGDEDFVTALLTEFHDDMTVTLVNCGHHPPLLITAQGQVEVPPSAEPVPPLGLGPTPSPVFSSWPERSRMLFFTDGLVEARDKSGAFFPLAEHAPQLREGSLEEALDRLVTRLTEYTGHRVSDDMALVIAQHRS